MNIQSELNQIEKDLSDSKEEEKNRLIEWNNSMKIQWKGSQLQ